PQPFQSRQRETLAEETEAVNRPPFEVADIIRQHVESFVEKNRSWLTWLHLRVLHAIESCRTAALGGHRDRCPRCGHRAISFNSCRNRHCPKCLTSARNKWLAERSKELLPVGYFHVVFTLPHELSWLALQNKKVVYDLLFRTSAATMLEIAADPKHLGAEIGFLSVLHTWGQNLLHHPHVHCVVPVGGLSADGARWVHPRDRFFLPVKVLSRVFRGKFVARLKREFSPQHARVARPLGPPRRCGSLPGVSPGALSTRLGRLCQTAVRRTRARAPRPRALHAPRGDLESSPGQRGRRSRHVSLEELRTRQRVKADDRQRDRIPAAI